MGLPLTIVAGVFLLYCFAGQYLPDPFVHRGYSFDQIVNTFAFGTEGIYGTPVYVSAAYIFIFVVFAAFLEKAGMIDLFNDFALGLVGGWRGGPAQVCVLSSALMGTISGSGVANVVASGQFTIPLMKRFGFRAAFAGCGGNILDGRPDHAAGHGAVAFIMAETLNVPYSDVVKAAIIPAFLYFGTCFWYGPSRVRQSQTQRHGQGHSAQSVERGATALAAGAAAHGLGLSPVCRIYADLCRTMGLALTIVLILGTPLAVLISPLALRIFFWSRSALPPPPS